MSCHPKYAHYQNNQMSTKMLRAKMINGRNKITYQTSKQAHIYKIIQSKDITTNQLLVDRIGETLYKKYYNRLANSPATSASEKMEYTTMFYDLFSDDSDTSVVTTPIRSDAELIADPDLTFYCIVSCVSTTDYGPEYLVITNLRFEHVLTPGKKYKFDLSDYRNSGFQLSLSANKYTFQDVENIHFIGTPGTSGACVIYEPSTTISLYQVYIYNKLDLFESGYNVFGRMFEKLVIELNYTITQQPRYTSTTPDQFITDLSAITDIRMIHNKGPKYYLEPYNQPTYGNIFNDKYFPNRQYGLKTGIYIILNKDWKNPFTILNGDNLTNPNICLYGNPAKHESIYVEGVTDISDANYDFYYGALFIDVSGDFGTVPFYSKKFGLNQMQSFFVYDPSSSAVIPDSTDISINKISTDLRKARSYIDFEKVKQWAIKHSVEILVDNSYYDFSRDPNNILNYKLFNTLFKTTTDLSSSILNTFADGDIVMIRKGTTYFSADVSYNPPTISFVNDTTIDNSFELQKATFLLEKDSNTSYYKIRYNDQNDTSYYYDISSNESILQELPDNIAYVVFDISYQEPIEIVDMSYEVNEPIENKLVAKTRYVYDGTSYQQDDAFVEISTSFTNIIRADFIYKMMDNFDFMDANTIYSQYTES
tara:strand:- start:11168 stop:13120 length:1953 start_codon:yes stop_codon:yes gene_type:complete